MRSFSSILDDVRTQARTLLGETLVCLRFYSRLTLPAWGFEAEVHSVERFGEAIRMLPVAGAILGCFGAFAVALARLLGLPPTLAAIAGIAVLMRVTGLMHEDGLADLADGLGGGGSTERKLEIMKDSRIGAFGAAALTMAILARTAALAELLGREPVGAAAAAIVAAAAVSRVAGLLPLALLGPAREGGTASAVGKLRRSSFSVAGLIALLVALILIAPSNGFGAAALACLLATAVALYAAHLGRRHLGGHTGDLAGAAQQLAEIAFLATLLIAPLSPD